MSLRFKEELLNGLISLLVLGFRSSWNFTEARLSATFLTKIGSSSVDMSRPVLNSWNSRGWVISKSLFFQFVFFNDSFTRLISGLILQFFLVKHFVSSVDLLEDRENEFEGSEDQPKRGLKSEQKSKMKTVTSAKRTRFKKVFWIAFGMKHFTLSPIPWQTPPLSDSSRVMLKKVLKLKWKY